MSKLKDLIAELCPHGVEFKKLGEVAEMKRGTSITKSNSVNGEYPVISGGREPAFYCNRYNREGETITVAGSGAGAGFVQFWNQKIFVNDAFSVKGTEKILTKFIYYCLTNLQKEIYSTKKGGGVPHVHISSIENFKIPIPPLPVQAEIVRILDTFTELIAELIAELKLRKIQYEYYRDKLLTFDNVPMVKLGEIGKVSMCKRIMKNQTSDSGEVPFYKIGTFGKTADAFISRELFEKYKSNYSYPNKGDILISAAGTIGRTVIFDGEPAYFQDSNIVWVANDETKVLNKFLYYLYQKITWQIQKGGTIARLYNDDISNAEIPIPPIEEQERIANILDKFDKLCNDLCEGIPAEIAARKKQYEYYRDLLLTFEEAK